MSPIPLAVALLLGSNPSTPRVGPVAIGDLARAIRKQKLSTHGALPATFTIEVATYSKPSRCTCTWPVGGPPSWQSPSQAEVDGGDDLARMAIDMGPASGDVDGSVWSVGEDNVPHGVAPRPKPTPHVLHLIENGVSKSVTVELPLALFTVSALCAETDRAALVLDYDGGPLDGAGWVVFFERHGGQWVLVKVEPTWLS